MSLRLALQKVFFRPSNLPNRRVPFDKLRDISTLIVESQAVIRLDFVQCAQSLTRLRLSCEVDIQALSGEVKTLTLNEGLFPALQHLYLDVSSQTHVILGVGSFPRLVELVLDGSRRCESWWPKIRKVLVRQEACRSGGLETVVWKTAPRLWNMRVISPFKTPAPNPLVSSIARERSVSNPAFSFHHQHGIPWYMPLRSINRSSG